MFSNTNNITLYQFNLQSYNSNNNNNYNNNYNTILLLNQTDNCAVTLPDTVVTDDDKFNGSVSTITV